MGLGEVYLAELRSMKGGPELEVRRAAGGRMREKGEQHPFPAQLLSVVPFPQFEEVCNKAALKTMIKTTTTATETLECMQD